MFNRIFISLALLCTSANGYKFLGIFPHTGKSHFDVFEPVMRALAEKGHEVTVISHFPQKEQLKRYTDISLAGTAEAMVDFLSVEDFTGRRYEKYLVPILVAYFGYRSCIDGLSSKPVQDFMTVNQTFDVIITEYFNTDCYLGFAHKFKVPVVSLSSCTLMPWVSERFGNPDNPAYIPDNMMGYSNKISFFGRVENTFVYVLHRIISRLFMDIPSYLIARKYFGADTPYVSDIAQNTSIMLINTHFSLNLPRPQVPNIIDVGGIHIRKIKPPPQVFILYKVTKYVSDSIFMWKLFFQYCNYCMLYYVT